MTARRGGAMGDAILIERKLKPRNDTTRERLDELLSGLEAQSLKPAPARLVDRDEHDEPSDARPATEPPPGQPAGGRARRWRAALLSPAWLGWGGAFALVALAIAAVRVLRAPASGAALGVILVGVAIVLAYRRRIRPLPSELSRPPFEARGREEPVILGPRTLGAPPPVEPLLEPRWATGILTAALAIETQDGFPDLDRLVDSLARLRVPARMPRRTRRSINAGAQVIVDFSEDMFAVRDDVFWIMRRLPRVFGERGVTILRCAGLPLTEVGPGSRETWGPYKPPSVRQPVLFITNFSLSAPGSVHDGKISRNEWAAVAMMLDRLRCPVVALVPNAEERVPPQLRRHVAVIEWDWTTTAGSASRAVRT